MKRTPYLIIGLFFIPYLLPVFGGLAWLPIGNRSQGPTGRTYPYGYEGAKVEVSPSADPQSTSCYNVPYFFQIKNYLQKHELPLWNANQDLGLPFAAMGEGSPYSPISLARALVPAEYHDVLTIVTFYFASIFFYLFLLEIGVGPQLALLSTAIYSLSGAFGTTILIPNISQTIVIYPLIFWSFLRYLNRGDRVSFYLVIASTVLIVLAGHMQETVIGLVGACLFSGIYALTDAAPLKQKIINGLKLASGVALGLILTAFYLGPFAAFAVKGHHVHDGLGTVANSAGTTNYMFDPFVFGGFGHDKITFDGTEVTWALHNLMHFGIIFFALACLGMYALMKQPRANREVLICFFLGVFFYLKLMGNPAALWIGKLPVFEKLSPKHLCGLITFFLVPISALGADRLFKLKNPGRVLVGLGALFLILMTLNIRRFFGWHDSFQYVGSSAGIRLVLLGLGLIAICRWADPKRRAEALTILLVCELALYVPLAMGQGEHRLIPGFILLGIATSILFTRSRFAFFVSASLTAALAFMITMTTERGLPKRQSVTKLPPYYTWIKNNMSDSYRTFGMPANYAQLIDVQSFEGLNPIATKEFEFFARAVDYNYHTVLWFSLSGCDPVNPVNGCNYSLKRYLSAKGIWDFLNLKYIVVDRELAARNAGETQEFRSHPSLNKTFEDDIAEVYESKSVLPKVFSSNCWLTARTPAEAQAYVNAHRLDLATVQPIAETSEEPPHGDCTGNDFHQVKMLKFGSNHISIESSVAQRHLLMVADNFDDGWSATLNGAPAKIVRVNAIVRGIVIPESHSTQTIELMYWPKYLSILSWISALCLAALLIAHFCGENLKKRLNKS